LEFANCIRREARKYRDIAMHQNSDARMLTEAELQAIKPLRYSRKISHGGGEADPATEPFTIAWCPC
jgi:hypothetical protein